MAQSVTGNIKVTVSASENVTNGLSTGSLSPSISYSTAFANGTGASSINYQFTKSGTLAASTPLTLTLSALTDDLGRSVPFSKIRAIVIANNNTVDNQPITVGNAGTHPWAAPFDAATDTIAVRSGGLLVLAAPNTTAYAVTASSSDQLKLDPGSNSVAYSLFIMGE